MRSKASLPPSASTSDSSSLPRSSSVLKIPSAGGHVPRQTVAPASASALAIANPKPPSSATPATNARLPRRSMLSMGAVYHDSKRGEGAAGRSHRPRVGPEDPEVLGDGGQARQGP